ncbi:MAG: NAD-dependent epimerase/dehydratase family protein [Naasia sp.]|nr:NAD-dependent epimerase/dehydratase family protein [Naasia sp.]
MEGMTRIAVVGAHGQVAQRLINLLHVRGDEPVGVIRSGEHADDLVRLGAEPAIVDIETASAEELGTAFAGAEAIVFAAGAGAGSTAERKWTVDYGGAVLSIAAAELAGVRRFVQISAIGVDAPLPDDTDEIWAAYVAAKRDADVRLRGSGLDWTILRPGALTTAPGTGRIRIGDTVPRGAIPRDDVAALVVAVLDEPRSIGRQWEAVGGDAPIGEAVLAAVS